MEKSNNRRKGLAVAGLAFAGTILLAGCEDTRDYKGEGDAFEVAGVVLDVQDDGTVHIEESQLVIEAAAGKSSTWFKDKNGQDTFSTNFYFEPSYTQQEPGFWGHCENEVTVGRVFNVEGTEIQPQDLKPGQIIAIDGSIRETSYWTGGKYATCTTHDRPVYDEITVIHTPLDQITGERVS